MSWNCSHFLCLSLSTLIPFSCLVYFSHVQEHTIVQSVLKRTNRFQYLYSCHDYHVLSAVDTFVECCEYSWLQQNNQIIMNRSIRRGPQQIPKHSKVFLSWTTGRTNSWALLPVLSEVAKGSAFGHLLLLIYINNLPDAISIVLHFMPMTPNVLGVYVYRTTDSDHLQADLDALSDCCVNNSLSFNTSIVSRNMLVILG